MTLLAVGAGLHPVFYVLSWMFFSNATIIFNKWLLGTAGFTIILTTIHLFTSVIFTQLLAHLTPLLPLPPTPILTQRRYTGPILAIGLCYTASLLCSNMAYLTLSVSFISMLKALAPVTTLVLSWAGGFTPPDKPTTPGTWAKVAVITFGVFLSSVGEVTFAWEGFTYQMLGTVSESVRLLLIGWLLASPSASADAAPVGVKAAEEGAAAFYEERRGRSVERKRSVSGTETDVDGAESFDKTAATARYREDDIEAQGGANTAAVSALAGMNPLVLLYYYAPVCAVFNLLVALMTEWRTFDAADLHRVGWSMLALNGFVAFMLNVSSVFLIGKTSALAMNLTGILKSVLLVLAAIMIWNTPITFIQAVGYGIALVGLLVYALPDDYVRQSPIAEVVLTHMGVYAVKVGNRLGLLGLGNTWGGRGGSGEGRYVRVSDGGRDEERDDSFALDGVEEAEGSSHEELEREEKLAVR